MVAPIKPNYAQRIQKLHLVHMCTELNNALKILISPKVREDLTYEEIKAILINRFDRKKNQYAESIKFRQIVQEIE